MKAITLIFVAFVVLFASADVYMHRFPGSNNRLKGQNRDRNNANRLFDSQNNDRGGYNAGSIYLYEGSKLLLEWTQQHSCGNANTRCEMILQYTCDDLLRDGTTETTIPDYAAACYNEDCDTDPRFGRHESWESYHYCKRRSRDLGLYTADQLNPNQKKKAQAIYTRQNAGATRYGYECPEERDYYPNWNPSPWKDIAILTNEPQRCDAYKAESQNVKGRYFCKLHDVFKYNLQKGPIPITKTECEAFPDITHPDYDDDNLTTNPTAAWTFVPPHNIPAPDCRQNVYSRDNHLGNAVGGQTSSYNWTIPADIHEHCAFRIRYNITSYDYAGFGNLTTLEPGFNVDNNEGILNQFYGFGDEAEVAKNRGYQLVGNPNVDIFGSLLPNNDSQKIKLQMNINTAQFFRTFEDRSHRFAIRSRTGKYSADANIHNIGVRGKRGNIVQVYPAVEYDYSPNQIDVTLGDYIHFQWTGSDNNPGNNDGNGRASTDRTNVVGTEVPNHYVGIHDPTSLLTYGDRAANYPKKLDSNTNFLGWDNQTLVDLALLQNNQLGGDMDQLNDAGTYFDLPPKMVGKSGIFNYFCTRNNNFSNRSQKGLIKVDVSRSSADVIGWNGGTIDAKTASLDVKEGAFTSAEPLALTVAPLYTIEDKTDVSEFVSDVVYLSGVVESTQLAGEIDLTIAHNASPISITKIVRTSKLEGKNTKWSTLSTYVDSDFATAKTNVPGIYVVREELNIGALVGIIIGCVVFVILIAILVMYCRKKANQEHEKYASVGV